MKKFHAVLSFFLTAVIAWSCGPSLKVTSDYDKGVNFSSYKTFALYNPENINNAISELNRARVVTAIKNEMTKKGFTESATNPDLLVNAAALFEDRKSMTATSTGGGYYGYRAYGWGAGVSHTNYDVRHYKDGSLIIDIVEASSKKLVWQGTGNKEIDGPVKDPDVNIPKAISMIMASFPPGAAGK